jgi:hypothetical protein
MTDRRRRLTLAWIVVGTGLGTILGLLFMSRGGAISHENQMKGLEALISVYLPLFALIIAFHFGKAGDEEHRSTAPFSLALTLVAFWCLAPAIVFVSAQVIEDSLETLSTLRPFGDGIVLGVLGYYFGRQ